MTNDLTKEELEEIARTGTASLRPWQMQLMAKQLLGCMRREAVLREVLEHYRAADDGVYQMLAGFKATPGMRDPESVAGRALDCQNEQFEKYTLEVNQQPVGLSSEAPPDALQKEEAFNYAIDCCMPNWGDGKFIDAGNILAIVSVAIDHYKERQPERESGWQPIETAPKDGTDLLLYDSSHMGVFRGIVIGSWKHDGNDYENEDPPGWFDNNGDSFSTGYYYTPLRPTHWMPLPPPPENTRRG